MDYLRKVRIVPYLIMAALLLFKSVQGQTPSQIKEITADYNLEKLAQIKSLSQQEAKKAEERLYWQLQKIGLEKKRVEQDGTVLAAKAIGPDGSLLYYETYINPTGKVTRANTLYHDGLLQLGLSGQGMSLGVWDAGKALQNHQEFDTRVHNTDLTEEIYSHSTMVTGVIASSGVKEEAKGVAYSANVISNDWTYDRTEAIDAAMNGLLISNHSYGISSSNISDWYFGAYIQISKNWDEIMYNAPYYLMVSAAGNARNSKNNDLPISGTATDGLDLMLGFNTSKNGLVVAGANIKVDDGGALEDAGLTSYSSYGPTDDGRIKPDLAGDGTSIFSTAASNDKSYGASTGTSMAAPGVSASLLLLQQYYQQLYGSFMKAATLKGLALHTADDVFEPGPDYKLGWGAMNAKAAAKLIQHADFSSLVMEEELYEGHSFSITVEANGNEPLMASLSWTDPENELTNQGVLNDGTPALINDLDIRITKNGYTYYPWALDPTQAHAPAVRGDNLVDPYERIEVANASGSYTITVSHKNNLKFNAQDFSLLVSGIKINNCTTEVPTGLHLVSAGETTTRLLWDNTEDTLYEFQYKKQDDELWTTYAQWDNTIEIDGLQRNQTYHARVRGICTASVLSEFSEELRFIFNGDETDLNATALGTDLEGNQLFLYPNPTENELKVVANTSGNATYYIFDMGGYLVKEGKLQTVVSVSDLPTGTYMISVLDAGVKAGGLFFKK